jgi:hypothetical protein
MQCSPFTLMWEPLAHMGMDRYVNGKHYPVELSTLDHVLFGAIRADQQLCLNGSYFFAAQLCLSSLSFKAYSRHELSDNDDVYSFFMRLPETQPKSFYKLKKSIENEDFQVCLLFFWIYFILPNFWCAAGIFRTGCPRFLKRKP